MAAVILQDRTCITETSKGKGGKGVDIVNSYQLLHDDRTQELDSNATIRYNYYITHFPSFSKTQCQAASNPLLFYSNSSDVTRN